MLRRTLNCVFPSPTRTHAHTLRSHRPLPQAQPARSRSKCKSGRKLCKCTWCPLLRFAPKDVPVLQLRADIRAPTVGSPVNSVVPSPLLYLFNRSCTLVSTSSLKVVGVGRPDPTRHNLSMMMQKISPPCIERYCAPRTSHVSLLWKRKHRLKMVSSCAQTNHIGMVTCKALCLIDRLWLAEPRSRHRMRFFVQEPTAS